MYFVFLFITSHVGNENACTPNNTKNDKDYNKERSSTKS